MHVRQVAGAQSVYYLATGLWPLVSPATFQRVTGPKRDMWLVHTVGLLVTVIGGTLAIASRDPSSMRSAPIHGLAIGSALSLATIDAVFVARRRISPVYLLDAVAELALITGWLSARSERHA